MLVRNSASAAAHGGFFLSVYIMLGCFLVGTKVARAVLEYNLMYDEVPLFVYY